MVLDIYENKKSVSALTQQITIEGRVTAKNGEAPMGVAILVKSDKDKESSNAVPTNVFDVYMGMEQDFTDFAKLAIVGYGQLKKNDLTGAVTSTAGENVNMLPLTGPVQGLQGKIADIQVSNSLGESGNPLIIRLSGISTLSNNPLFVVNGAIVDAAQQGSDSSLDLIINTNGSSSVEVPKDASTTSIFGARGSNGTIIITSKQGKQVEMHALEFGEYINAIRPRIYNNLEAWANVDWQDETFDNLELNYQMVP